MKLNDEQIEIMKEDISAELISLDEKLALYHRRGNGCPL